MNLARLAGPGVVLDTKAPWPFCVRTGVFNTDAGARFDGEWFGSFFGAFQPDSTACQTFAVMANSDSKGKAQRARASGKAPVYFQFFSALKHDRDSVSRLNRTYQYGVRNVFTISDYVEEGVHSIAEIDVGNAALFKHGLCSLCAAVAISM